MIVSARAGPVRGLSGLRLRVVVFAAVATLAACSGGADERPAVIDVYGAAVHRDSLARELRLFIWPDYLHRTLVQEFEETYGVRVVIDYYDNNEALIAKLTAGGLGQYDVVVASDYAVEVLQREQRLLPLEHGHIPNLVNL
jgi:spermidine/putrescine-binding protein